MAKKLLGLCTCPECHFDEAEVKTTKAGLAYRWCPECNAQYFPRCESTSKRLVDKCHTVAEQEEKPAQQVPEQKPQVQPVPKPQPKPRPAPKKAGAFDFLFQSGATA